MFRSAAVLGLLSAVGPFTIDMYLPAMPAIGRDLSADVGAVQMTITAYFIAFGLAQLVYGPWADQAGRRTPVFFGLTLFILASLGCTFAPTMGALVAFRFLQGLGAAVVMVVPRAIIRDLYTGNEATRLMALVMLVISVSPMLAPLAGSGVIAVFGWRAIFAILCLAAVASLLLTRFALPETLPPEHRVPIHFATLLSGARGLLGDRKFLGLTFTGGFGIASFFVFIASASFVYTGQYGLSPTGFSLAFALNAIGFFAASQLAATLGERFGARRVVLWATAGFATMALTTLALIAAGFTALPVLMGGLFLGNAFLGLVLPTTMVMALDEHGDVAGLASSLGGTLQMLAGGVVTALSGVVFDGTALPMIAAIAGCAVTSFLLALSVLGRPARARA
ncbi:MAG: multidrug effflux MFS transporter [Rhodobacteraceae bacterium]|nr:multidrug effflux MFS transporter [Paracoccaceae bacterium]